MKTVFDDLQGLIGEDWLPLIDRDPKTLTEFEREQIIQFVFTLAKKVQPERRCSHGYIAPAHCPDDSK